MWALCKVIFQEVLVNVTVSCSRCLFQSIKCLLQLENFVFFFFHLVSQWLLNVHFFLEDSIQEGRLHIHLMNSPFVLSCKREYQSYGLQATDRSKHLIIINPNILTITFCNQPCLLSFSFSLDILLCFVHPLDTNGLVLFWKGDEFLCVVLLDGSNFFIHFISITFIFSFIF